MTLKPWREVAIPHEDVRKGTFQQAEFAADLSRVHSGTATPEYQDPAQFYRCTFITEGMRLLLDSLVKRLSGRGGDPVIQLQTAFGGGKTHTMLAVYHLAGGKAPASALQGVPAILDAAGIVALPSARIAVIDGIQVSPNQPVLRDGHTIRTLWGDLAWQLAGPEGYALVSQADASGTSPGKAVLQTLLERSAPCVILVDELVAYVRQFEEGRTLTGGTFDSILSFVQALTEALKAVPTAIMLASLPASEREAGSERGVRALESIAHCFGRVQAIWKPVATEEAFEIVRRRLFAQINDTHAAEQVCRQFADLYAQQAGFPHATQERRYFDRMRQAYPIHPEVFDRLYEDWSTLDTFQRTRGVLKLMAKVIFRLWQSEDKDPLIMPANFPLDDGNTRNDLIAHLPPGWDPVVDTDIDGQRAVATDIDTRDPRLGPFSACRRTARTIFLGSAPSGPAQVNRGMSAERILLGSVIPGQATGVYTDALNRLVNQLHFINVANNHYWFDTRPNLRREMEDRKRRFDHRTDILPEIRERTRRLFANGVFGAVHVMVTGADIPDDWSLRLVVLSPDQAYSRSGVNQANDAALAILRQRGDQPRFKQNRLIFLAADYDAALRLKEHVRTLLAWRSIVDDIGESRLNLDQFQAKQATRSLNDATEVVQRSLRETYKWLLAPMQEAQPRKGLSEIQWEAFPVNAASPNLTQELERILRENELLISEWAPVHLRTMLKDWFWTNGAEHVSAQEVWKQMCQQLYLPRLKDDTVYRRAIDAGLNSSEFFGTAQGFEGERYVGFSLGRAVSVFVDGGLLLIEPPAAAAYAAKLADEEAALAGGRNPAGIGEGNPPSMTRNPDGVGGSATVGPSGSSRTPAPTVATNQPSGSPPATARKTRFYASVDLDAVRARADFGQIYNEVIMNVSTLPGVRLKLTFEFEAELDKGFDDAVMRTVRENCSTLKIVKAGFEE